MDCEYTDVDVIRDVLTRPLRPPSLDYEHLERGKNYRMVRRSWTDSRKRRSLEGFPSLASASQMIHEGEVRG